jgi:hypothetical protein
MIENEKITIKGTITKNDIKKLTKSNNQGRNRK